MTAIRQILQHNRLTLMKTGSYYVIHVCVAATVAYAVTGSLWASLTLSLLEPSVQAVAFFFHEKAWARALRRRAAGLQARVSSSVPSTSSAVRSTSALAPLISSTLQRRFSPEAVSISPSSS